MNSRRSQRHHAAAVMWKVTQWNTLCSTLILNTNFIQLISSTLVVILHIRAQTEHVKFTLQPQVGLLSFASTPAAFFLLMDSIPLIRPNSSGCLALFHLPNQQTFYLNTLPICITVCLCYTGSIKVFLYCGMDRFIASVLALLRFS